MLFRSETQSTFERRYEGRRDGDLTDTGIAQAHLAASTLAAARIKAIYASPRLRALRTAQIIADRLGLSPVVLDGLAEVDFGEWEGLTYEETRLSDPDRLDRWYEDPFSNRPPGGESLTEMWERVRLSMTVIAQSHEGSRAVAVISHGGPIRALESYCEHGDLRAFWSVSVHPGEVKPVRLRNRFRTMFGS